MIAVDMLTHAQRNLVGEATLITNDQDFYPVVVAVMELGLKVHLLCDPHKTNDEFMYLSDETTRLDLNLLYHWLPEEFRKNYTLPLLNMNAKNVSANWNEGNFALGKAKSHMWQLQNLSSSASYFHKNLTSLLEFSVLEWPNCKELRVLLDNVKVDGEKALHT